MPNRKNNKPAFMPTPEAIAEACEAIQRNWNAREKASRYCGPVTESWRPPWIDCRAFGGITPDE